MKIVTTGHIQGSSKLILVEVDNNNIESLMNKEFQVFLSDEDNDKYHINISPNELKVRNNLVSIKIYDATTVETSLENRIHTLVCGKIFKEYIKEEEQNND